MKLELEHYTPGEAEVITQVAQITVRNWRRAGFLPRPKGHARYSIADLMGLTAMQTLVSRGVAPDVAKGYAGEAARAAFQYMICAAKSYSEGVGKLAQEEAGEISPELVEQLSAALGGSGTAEDIQRLTAQARIMDAARDAFGFTGLKAPTWFIIWANGEMQFYYEEDISEQTFFGNTAYDEYVKGPITIFSLPALAQMVIDRLPRPAIKLVGEV